eukprot:215681-Amphidinium_carterae.1
MQWSYRTEMTVKPTETGSSVSSAQASTSINHDLAGVFLRLERHSKKCKQHLQDPALAPLSWHRPILPPRKQPQNRTGFGTTWQALCTCTFRDAHAHNDTAKRARKHRREAARAAQDEGCANRLAAIVSRSQTRNLDPDVGPPIR